MSTTNNRTMFTTDYVNNWLPWITGNYNRQVKSTSDSDFFGYKSQAPIIYDLARKLFFPFMVLNKKVEWKTYFIILTQAFFEPWSNWCITHRYPKNSNLFKLKQNNNINNKELWGNNPNFKYQKIYFPLIKNTIIDIKLNFDRTHGFFWITFGKNL